MEGHRMRLEPASAGLEKRVGRFDFTLEVLMSYPPSNYDDPIKRGPELYIINSIFFAAMVVCVVIRLYTRIFIRKWFGWDDFFILLAVIGATGVTACVMLGTHKFGWDRHIYDVRPNLLQPSGQLLFASKILWSFTSNSVRASVMCLYYRLLSHVGMNQYRWILHLNSVFILGIFITQQTTTIFACRPIKTVWTWPPIFTSKCIDNGAAIFTNAILNTFSEAIVAVLPLPIIFTLNVTHHQRNMIIGMLCGGILVVVVGSVRSYFVWEMIATFDPSWWGVPHWITSEVEMDVAIICACIPAITPVFRRIMRGGFSAMKSPEPLSSSRNGSSHQGNRTRMFFTKLKDDMSSAAVSTSSVRSTPSTEQTESQRTIDLEGIKPDGYGYTVTITTGRGTKVRRRWNIREKTWHYYPEQDMSDMEVEEEDITTGPKKRSIFSQGSAKHKRSGSGPRPGEGEKPGMEVKAETTLDIRESFHSQNLGTGFDWRNPYKAPKYEEDIEIGIQVPEAPISDWSMFDEEMGRTGPGQKSFASETGHLRKDMQEGPIPSSPAIPTSARLKRHGSAYDSQRYSASKRHSTESIRPKTDSSRVASSHKGSRSYDNIRMGVLTSPSTANFDWKLQQPLHKPASPPRTSILHPPSPPPLPPAARVRRSTSPALNPMNSSHPWVTSTFFGDKSDESSRSGGGSPNKDLDEQPYAPPPTGTPKARPGSHDTWKKSSIQSSLRAENGSGRSVAVAMRRQRLQVAPRASEESSEDDFALPLQRPSPRNSIVYDQGPFPEPPRSVPAIEMHSYG